VSNSLGHKAIAALLTSGKLPDLLSVGPVNHLFKGSEEPVWEFVLEHCKKFGQLPKIETVEAHTDDELPTAEEPFAYYLEIMGSRHVEQTLKKTMKDAAGYLGLTGKDPEKALLVMSEAIMQLIAKKQMRQVSDFRDAYDEIVSDYIAKYTSDDSNGIRFGWETLDNMTGGLVVGDLASFVGRPQKGKTWQMLYSAMHSWNSVGACQMFVSMEMKPLPIKQRMIAMQAHIPAMKLKNAELSTNYVNKMKSTLLEIKNAKSAFWVVDGNFTANVEDIWMLARQLKPDSIWIDGGYLLKHPRERDRYRRVAENAELIKQELSDLAPTVVSWQFAKSGAKKNKKKGESADLEDIGYTDAIAQVSSLVLGLLDEDSVETMFSRLIEIMKGRNGEVGRFRTHWDFNAMDFSELIEVSIEDLKYI